MIAKIYLCPLPANCTYVHIYMKKKTIKMQVANSLKTIILTIYVYVLCNLFVCKLIEVLDFRTNDQINITLNKFLHG